MGRRPSGVLTIPGYLTSHLDDLDLSRKDLAEQVGVSVRTIHNIEHGRKRVDHKVIDRLAQIINRQSLARYPQSPPLGLTADHFINSPESVVSVFLQSIALNRPDMLFAGDEPVASEQLLWHAPGRARLIPFAGDYAGPEVHTLLGRLHSAIRHVGLEGVRILTDRTNSEVIVRAISHFEHPASHEILEFPAYVEIQLCRGRLGPIMSTYDTGLLSEFLASGQVPRRYRA